MSITELKSLIKRQQELQKEAGAGLLDVGRCVDFHYPLVVAGGLIQCCCCMAMYDKDQHIIPDLKARLGSSWKQEYKRLKSIKKKVHAHTIDDSPTLVDFELSNGKIQSRYFYE